MADPDPQSAPVQLDGNVLLRLDGSHAWRLRSGSVALFRLRERAELPERRRHLCGVEAGGAVLWQPPVDGAEVAIVTLRPSVLEAVHMNAMVEAAANGQDDAVEEVRGWLMTLGAEREPARAATHTSPLGADAAAILERLREAQSRFLGAIERIDAQRETDTRERFQARQRLDERVINDTIEGLTNLGVGKGDAPARHNWTQSPLMAVLGQVGAKCGMDVVSPAGDERTAPSLQRILDASGARCRKVVLSGAWWRTDGEPIIASLEANGGPVGLVPMRRRWFRGVGYRAYFPDAAPREVDAKLAEEIAPAAFAITAPMDGPMTTIGVLRWTLRGKGREFATALLSGIALVLVGMLTPQATKVLFETAIPDGDRGALFELGAALLAATLGGLLFDLARSLSLLRLTSGSVARLQLGIWDRLLDQGPGFFRRFSVGDLESRVNATTQIHGALNVTTQATLIGAVASVLNVALLFAYSPMLATAGLVVAAVAVGIAASSAVLMHRAIGPLQEVEGQLRGLLIQLLGAVAKLRVAGAERRAFGQWGRAYALRIGLAQRVRTVSDRVRLVSAILPALGTAVLFWFAASDLFSTQPAISVGTFIAFSAAFGTFLAGVTTLGTSVELLLSVSAMWARLSPILETNPEIQRQKNPPGRLTGAFRIDHVTFRYRADGPLTLDDVSIEAAPGECIALVGPSGSGKSTIVNLLLRFEAPDSGAVYLDNHDLKGLDTLGVRQQIGVVSQETNVLASSIYENITADHPATHDEAWEAARAAGIEEEIRQMPMGLHTLVAEGGTNLSGGQRQRLLLARALLRKPALMILDEATSALDNRSQAIVTDSLNRLKVTRILIAHRLSTIRQADRIYVIEAGRVVQRGSFDELMRAEGLFARLMRRQVA
ncbi:MAG: NHLP bacteriocin export ABC transporter permease/ATPase subunit [Acidobacteriota bacterium]